MCSEAEGLTNAQIKRTANGAKILTNVAICSMFEFDGKPYGLSVSAKPEESPNTPEIYLSLEEIERLALQLKDLAWSHRETRKFLENPELLQALKAS